MLRGCGAPWEVLRSPDAFKQQKCERVPWEGWEGWVGGGPAWRQALLPGHGGREGAWMLDVWRGALQEPGVDAGCHPQGSGLQLAPRTGLKALCL